MDQQTEPATETDRAPTGPPSEPPLPSDGADTLARLLKALGDPTRLQLIALVHQSPTGEATVRDLTAPFAMTQPAISHHLRILVDAGIFRRDKRGPWAWYSLNVNQLLPMAYLVPGPTFLDLA